jgi:tetratricopeptide (TPR) repeat protein
MKIKKGIILCIIFVINCNLTAQEWSLKTKAQLLDKGYYYSFGLYRYDKEDINNLAINSKKHYFMANEYLKKGDLNNALEYYEIALSMYAWGAYYYQYGVCLMDMGDYESAEQAFKNASNVMLYEYPYSMIAPYVYHKSERNTIYTFDMNGVVRENYFSYYNLACIYSLTGRLNESISYIKLAIEYGYPYFNHIFTDPDLSNVFNLSNSMEIKEEINLLYSAGTVNNVSGKSYSELTSPASFAIYEFIDDSHVKTSFYSFGDQGGGLNNELYGTYKIINYHIIIYYDKETGRERQNHYINGKGIIEAHGYEYISIKEIIDKWEGE